MEPGAWDYKWDILSLGDINAGTWFSRLKVEREADYLVL
jgi:hypothetical protein